MNKTKLFWSILFIIGGLFEVAFIVWVVIDNIIKSNPWYYYTAVILPVIICVFWWIAAVHYIRDKDIII